MGKVRDAKVAPEEFTFGIEIECGVPNEAFYANNLSMGGYHRGLRQQAFIDAGLPEWNIQSDASLSFGSGTVAMEVTSPILQGIDGVEQTIKMVNLLKSWGAKVNTSTGLHVTLGHSDFRKVSTVAQIIVAMYHRSDSLVAVGASFGRRSRTYSMSLIHKYGLNHTRKSMGSDAAFVARYAADRRQALNVSKWQQGRLEFRLFAGTLNTNRMLAAIWSSIALCQNAMSAGKLTTMSTGALGCYSDARYYRSNVERTFKVFGWTGNDWSTKMGVMHPDHFDPNTFDKVIKQIRKDAKRMDEANARVGFVQRVPRPVRRATRQPASSPSNSEGE